MIKAQCHCGNVKLEARELPVSITRCNCSVCNRLGALWAYYSPEDVDVNCTEAPTAFYIWGDKYLEFHHCTICGCSTHYTVTKKYRHEFKEGRIAINFRMFASEIVASIPVREVDGASF